MQLRFQARSAKHKVGSKVIYAFVAITLVSLLILPFSNLILKFTRATFTPVLTSSVDTITRLKNFKNYFRTLDYYKDENIRLNARISELERALEKVIEPKEKIRRLELLLDIKNETETKGYFVTAGRASMRNDGEFVINKGSESGISSGSAVVSCNGFFGYVVEASEGYSVIKTVLDKDTEICVRNVRNGISDIAYGNGNCMVLTNVNDSVCDGDLIETSGADGLPEGISVGEIQGVYEKGGKLSALIRPFENISELSEVMVIVNE